MRNFQGRRIKKSYIYYPVTKKIIINGSIFILTLFVLVIVYKCKNPTRESDYFNPNVLATHFNGERFVGSTTCMECHADIYTTHLETAHFKSSAIANAGNVKGSFEEGSNMLDLRDVAFEMKTNKDSLYQHTTLKNRSLKKPPSKFDIVIGSGVKGQSYLTWENDALYQMQVSYYTPSNEWVNSPSFPNYDYSRPIGDACLKCHMTFAANQNTSKQRNTFDKDRMVYGIDCERCHRPGEKHVVYHRNNPDAKEAKYMLRLQDLPRQQRLDACAQCHSGLRNELLKGSPFSYLTGEVLSEYSRNNDTLTSNQNLDVHGNQYGLLSSSECFKQSATLDCNTCHDPHKNQRGNSNYFNSKCIGCHDVNKSRCTAEAIVQNKMQNNCIACHMPTIASKAMQVQLIKDSLETSFYVRSHLIGVYAKEQWEN